MPLRIHQGSRTIFPEEAVFIAPARPSHFYKIRKFIKKCGLSSERQSRGGQRRVVRTEDVEFSEEAI